MLCRALIGHLYAAIDVSAGCEILTTMLMLTHPLITEFTIDHPIPALILYIYLLTIADEVRFVWHRPKLTLVSWIFIAHRILLLVCALSFLSQYIFPDSSRVRFVLILHSRTTYGT